MSTGTNTVNIYGNKVVINSKSIAFDGITSLSSITVGTQSLSAMINAMIEEKLDGR